MEIYESILTELKKERNTSLIYDFEKVFNNQSDRFYFNHRFNIMLLRINPNDTRDIRKCLFQDGSDADWFDVLKNNVLPYLSKHYYYSI